MDGFQKALILLLVVVFVFTVALFSLIPFVWWLVATIFGLAG